MTRPAASPPAGSDEVRLDLELAARAIGELEAVRQQLIDLRYEAGKLGRASPSAHDAVSVEAFTLLVQKADGVPGSLGLALDAGIVHVQTLIDQMKADVAGEQEADQTAAASLRSS